MRRYLWIFFIFSVCILILSGCKKETTPLCRVVTAVEITGRQPSLQFSKTYTQNEQIEAILQYLRSIQSRKRVNQIDERRLHTGFVITLHLSDGEAHHYALLGHRYFKAPGKPWMEIDGNKAVKLYKVLQNTELGEKH